MAKRKNINSRKQSRKPATRSHKPSPRQILETGIAPQTFKPVILEPVTYKAPTLTSVKTEPRSMFTPITEPVTLPITATDLVDRAAAAVASVMAEPIAIEAPRAIVGEHILRISGALAVIAFASGAVLWFVG